MAIGMFNSTTSPAFHERVIEMYSLEPTAISSLFTRAVTPVAQPGTRSDSVNVEDCSIVILIAPSHG